MYKGTKERGTSSRNIIRVDRFCSLKRLIKTIRSTEVLILAGLKITNCLLHIFHKKMIMGIITINYFKSSWYLSQFFYIHHLWYVFMWNRNANNDKFRSETVSAKHLDKRRFSAIDELGKLLNTTLIKKGFRRSFSLLANLRNAIIL